MENAYVAPSRVREAARLTCRNCDADDASLRADDPALHALTDFHQEYPITVHAERPAPDALRDMTRLGVHALLVTRPDHDGAEEHVLGLVTASDMRRRGPLRRLRAESGECRPVVVEAVMTVWDDLSLVNYDSLLTLSAMDLYRRFEGTGLTHLLVIEHADDGGTLARGMISRASLGRRLRRASADDAMRPASRPAH